MKLKLWVEILLYVIAFMAGVIMTFDVEISLMPFICGSIIFVSTCAILTEYGRLIQYLEYKIEKFNNK